jgi:predicted hotdog family 3-hydroxylacyl-ACP dehydratase
MYLVFPVKVAQIRAILPHRPPMVWIDDILSGTHEGGICRTIPVKESLYLSDGTFLKYTGIELIAQAFGFSRGVYELSKNAGANEPARAFLVGIRTFSMAKIPAGVGSLLVETKLFRELPPLLLVDGTVRSEATGEEFMKVQLKLFFE